MITRTSACLLLVAALALPAEATAAARGKGKAPRAVLKTVAVDTHYVEPPPSVDGFDCRPSRLGAGRSAAETCKLRFVGAATFTGTIDAHETYELLGWFEPNGDLRYEGSATFTGTVAGCGTSAGSFVMDVADGAVYADRFDPATMTTKGYNTWTIRRGSGTGGLEGLVSGSGVNHWTEHMLQGHDGSDTFGYGHTTGTVTCRVPVPGSRGSRAR